LQISGIEPDLVSLWDWWDTLPPDCYVLFVFNIGGTQILLLLFPRYHIINYRRIIRNLLGSPAKDIMLITICWFSGTRSRTLSLLSPQHSTNAAANYSIQLCTTTP